MRLIVHHSFGILTIFWYSILILLYYISTFAIISHFQAWLLFFKEKKSLGVSLQLVMEKALAICNSKLIYDYLMVLSYMFIGLQCSTFACFIPLTIQRIRTNYCKFRHHNAIK